MNCTKLIFNKYIGESIKFLSKVISHKFVYLLVLSCLVTMDLNINFMHKKMSAEIRREVYYRINFMLDLENLKKINSFTSFFSLIHSMVKNSQKPNILFKVNRLNLHFLSESSMDTLSNQFEPIKDSMTTRETSVEYMYLKEDREIIIKKANHEMILRLIDLNHEKLSLLSIGKFF